MGQALQKRRKHQICNSIGHKMTSEVTKQPTCTEDGLTRHYCTRRGCKYEYTTNAPVRLGHVSDSPKEYQPVTLSCVTDGKTCTASRKWTQPCTRCGTNLNSGTDTATATVTSAVKTAATCTTKGTTTYTHRFSESWAPAQHTKDVQDIPVTSCASWQAPTYSWASDGSTCTAFRKCNLNTHIEAAPVYKITAEVKTAATCTTKGTTTYTATFKTSWATTQTIDIEDIAIDTSNHTNIVYGGTSAIHQKCTACGVTTSSSHTYNQSNTNSTYLKSGATCTSPAVYYKSCVCGYSNKSTTFTSGSVNSSNHTGSAVNGGTSGVHTKYSCCGATISSQHSYTSITIPANCQNYSSTEYTCSCGYSYATTGNTYGDHVWEQGATGSTGYCRICGYTCTHDNADYVSYQNGWHDLTCPDCGYTQYSQCTSNYSCTESDGETFYWNPLSPTQHSFECEFCDYSVIEDHTGLSTGECTKCGQDCLHNSGYYYGEQYPDTESPTWGCSMAEHEYYCSVCNKYLGRQSCNLWDWTNIVDNGDGTHTCTCTECGNSYIENHYDVCDGSCACGYQIGGSGGDTGGGSGGAGGVCTYDHSLTSPYMSAVNECGGTHAYSECVGCGYIVRCGGPVSSYDGPYWGCPWLGGTCQVCGASVPADPDSCG